MAHQYCSSETESCTTGYGGGLNCEPLKAIENLEPPQGDLVQKKWTQSEDRLGCSLEVFA
jgi:hypothetical protein